MNSLTPAILVVEDNEDDVFFLRRALEKAGVTLPVHLARDGREAMEYLSGTGRFSDRTENPLPSLIFLDLKMPCVDGFRVLDWMQGQASLRNVNVVVLTSSPEQCDRHQAKKLGAKSYLVKPLTEEMISQVMHFVGEPAVTAF